MNIDLSHQTHQLVAARSVLGALADAEPADRALAPVTALAWLGRVSPPLAPVAPLEAGVEVSTASAVRALEAAAAVATDAGEGLRIAQAAEVMTAPAWP